MGEPALRAGGVFFPMVAKSTAKEIKTLLSQRGETIATAESCTGGLVGASLTDESGISSCYLGGVISYSNDAKMRILGVPDEILQSFGAVSPQCAAAMADGARRLFGADYAISVTGIAGPEGGTPLKPVGLVYIAASSPFGTTATENRLAGDRRSIREQSAQIALTLLLKTISSAHQASAS